MGQDPLARSHRQRLRLRSIIVSVIVAIITRSAWQSVANQGTNITTVAKNGQKNVNGNASKIAIANTGSRRHEAKKSRPIAFFIEKSRRTNIGFQPIRESWRPAGKEIV
jgi:hypothetical protein